jgi:hypothetical protein
MRVAVSEWSTASPKTYGAPAFSHISLGREATTHTIRAS